MRESYFEKSITDAIKGIALICMFIHHFFTFPDWWVDGISYPGLSTFAYYFCAPLKICVSVFAFLTGYFYFFNKNKNYCYSFRKITDILISYWTIYIPFLCFAILVDCYDFNISLFVLELFACKRPIMVFCWYVRFYCCTMLILPLLTKMTKEHPVIESILLMLLPNVVCIVMGGHIPNAMLKEIISNIKNWLPCVTMGYLFAKYRVFNVIDDFAEGLKKDASKILLYLLIVCVAFMGRFISSDFTIGTIHVRSDYFGLSFTTDIFYAPLFIYGFAKLLGYFKIKIVHKILEAIGKQSLLMWFLHCFFFNVCSGKTQKILYFLKNPVLVTIFGLALCYIVALLVSYVLKPILKKKNNLIDCIDKVTS